MTGGSISRQAGSIDPRKTEAAVAGARGFSPRK